MSNWRNILSYKIEPTGLPEVGEYIRVKALDPKIMKYDVSKDVMQEIFDNGVIGQVLRVDREIDVLEIRFEGWRNQQRRLAATWTLHNLDEFDEYYEIVY